MFMSIKNAIFSTLVVLSFLTSSSTFAVEREMGIWMPMPGTIVNVNMGCSMQWVCLPEQSGISNHAQATPTERVGNGTCVVTKGAADSCERCIVSPPSTLCVITYN
jgi:hypothetical protein